MGHGVVAGGFHVLEDGRGTVVTLGVIFGTEVKSAAGFRESLW
jgi:hypothetical protein